MRLSRSNFYDNNEYLRMPVLFMPFCKIQSAKKVFAAIKKAMPKKLYVFSDGPTPASAQTKENVEFLRGWVVENVDWDCEVFCNFQDKNLGTRFGIEAAIDWFFENEEMGIILEDDCLPAPSFFRFCSEMLMKYKDEEKVFLINGTNETAKNTSANSYSFKKVTDFSEDAAGIWGWATWKRTWIKHDKKVLRLQEYKKAANLSDSLTYEDCLLNTRIKNICEQLEYILEGKNNTWDIQLRFSALINDGLFVVPDCNLVGNIGCSSSDSAHKTFKYSVAANLGGGEILFPLEHPKEIAARPLSAKEYIRASFVPNFSAKEFWQTEATVTDRILTVHNFLVRSNLEKEQKSLMYLSFLGDSLFELINNAVACAEFSKAQKYFHSALSDGALKAQNSPCSKCEKKKCLLVCPTKSISLKRSKDGEESVAIDEKNCDACFACMRNCPAVNNVQGEIL